jgi:hypothetical protein
MLSCGRQARQHDTEAAYYLAGTVRIAASKMGRRKRGHGDGPVNSDARKHLRSHARFAFRGGRRQHLEGPPRMATGRKNRFATSMRTEGCVERHHFFPALRPKARPRARRASPDPMRCAITVGKTKLLTVATMTTSQLPEWA